MTTRHPNWLATVAIGTGLFFSGGAFAQLVDDFPAMPFDQVTATTGDFAAFATNSTPVDDIPTTGTGQDPTENTPEPATLTLLGLGGAGAWWHMRRRKVA